MEHLNWKGTHVLHRWPLHNQFDLTMFGKTLPVLPVKFPAMGVVWSKEQIVNLERFGAALLVTSECTLAAGHKKAAGFGGWRSHGHSDEQIFWKIPRVMGWFWGPRFHETSSGGWFGKENLGKSVQRNCCMIFDCLLAVGDITWANIWVNRWIFAEHEGTFLGWFRLVELGQWDSCKNGPTKIVHHVAENIVAGASSIQNCDMSRNEAIW